MCTYKEENVALKKKWLVFEKQNWEREDLKSFVYVHEVSVYIQGETSVINTSFRKNNWLPL